MKIPKAIIIALACTLVHSVSASFFGDIKSDLEKDESPTPSGKQSIDTAIGEGGQAAAKSPFLLQE